MREIDRLIGNLEARIVGAPFWSIGIAWFFGAVFGVVFS